jgi:hypothetical protein
VFKTSLLNDKLMETQFRKSAGICLTIGAVLATLTMAMHPVGGSLADIAHMKSAFTFSHGMAIFCLPFIAFGFWGLSTALTTNSKVSFLAFSIICFGLVAAMIAGTINGLVLPSFASKYASGSVDGSILHPIRVYGNFINLSMDYIFIGAISLSIIIWSYLIVTKKKLAAWLGYYGLLIVLGTTTALLLKLNFTSVIGFSIYTFCVVSWIIASGVLLTISSKKNNS